MDTPNGRAARRTAGIELSQIELNRLFSVDEVAVGAGTARYDDGTLGTLVTVTLRGRWKIGDAPDTIPAIINGDAAKRLAGRLLEAVALAEREHLPLADELATTTP
jgi:hypothetical protein